VVVHKRCIVTSTLVQFTAADGKTYPVHYKATLSDADWLTLRHASAQLVTRLIAISDPEAASLPQRFHRVATP